ncbi:MAG: hypothetical protein R2828_06220 [Saprospiraceae bacterium]
MIEIEILIEIPARSEVLNGELKPAADDCIRSGVRNEQAREWRRLSDTEGIEILIEIPARSEVLNGELKPALMIVYDQEFVTSKRGNGGGSATQKALILPLKLPLKLFLKLLLTLKLFLKLKLHLEIKH